MQFSYERQLDSMREYAEDLQDRLADFLDHFPRRRRRRGRLAQIAGMSRLAWGKSREATDRAVGQARHGFRALPRMQTQQSSWWPAILGLVVLAATAGLVYWAYQSGFFGFGADQKASGFEEPHPYGATEPGSPTTRVA